MFQLTGHSQLVKVRYNKLSVLMTPTVPEYRHTAHTATLTVPVGEGRMLNWAIRGSAWLFTFVRHIK
jgi:hypothetical protein